jgi:large subunit ribosomal protein L25
MTDNVLNTEIREGIGKGASKKLRRGGIIPAVFYHKDKSRALQINEREFIKVLKSGKQVIELKIEGKKKRVLIKDVQFHPVSEHVMHVDFQEVMMSEIVHVMVPLNFVGKPAGVKEGGLFDVNMHEVEVKCKASDIPQQLDVDVTALQIGDTLHVEDLHFENIEIVNSGDQLIASVTVAKDLVEEIEAEAEAEAEEELEGEEAEGEEEEDEEEEEQKGA